MSDNYYDRRTMLKHALVGLATMAGSVLTRKAPAQGAPVKLDESDPLAKTLSYVHDASKLDPVRNAPYKPGQQCANCLQLEGKEGETWRPCKIFAGKLVNANGWCKVWAKKT